MITPYYQDQFNTIYCGDCRDILSQLDNVDLILTDPPYSIGASNEKFKSGSLVNQRPAEFYGDWDNELPSKEIFELMFKKSKNQIIWGGNYFIDYLKSTRCMIFWDKNTTNTSYADGEIAWTSFDKNVKLYRISWVGANAKDGAERLHPTQKSLKLFIKTIQDFTVESDVILDNFMGVGTTLVAAKIEGRKSIGIEKSEDYCRKAVQRLKETSPKLKVNWLE